MSWWRKLFPGKQLAAQAPAEAATSSPTPAGELQEIHPMQTERPVAELQRLLRPHARPAWLPHTVDEDHGADASKFGGMSLVGADYPVPVCPGCLQAMPLFVQLNPVHLPAEMAGRLHGKVLQLFYCTNECDDGFMPFSSSSVARLVPLSEPVTGVTVAESFPAKTIIGWELVEDYPHWDDWEDVGLDLTIDEGVVLEQESDEEISPSDQDKLGGWPHWIQGAEYPDCPDCGRQMQLLMQLASEDHLPYMFGDMGIGHITQCPQHPEVLAFGWACT